MTSKEDVLEKYGIKIGVDCSGGASARQLVHNKTGCHPQANNRSRCLH